MILKLPIVLLVLFFLISCATPSGNNNRYQAADNVAASHLAPVAELHKKAFEALAQERPSDAVAFLQKAIKIDPRNAHTWHYLARSYWHGKQNEKCLDMIARSVSYSHPSNLLDQANGTLKKQCQNG